MSLLVHFAHLHHLSHPIHNCIKQFEKVVEDAENLTLGIRIPYELQGFIMESQERGNELRMLDKYIEYGKMIPDDKFKYLTKLFIIDYCKNKNSTSLLKRWNFKSF